MISSSEPSKGSSKRTAAQPFRKNPRQDESCQGIGFKHQLINHQLKINSINSQIWVHGDWMCLDLEGGAKVGWLEMPPGN